MAGRQQSNDETNLSLLSELLEDAERQLAKTTPGQSDDSSCTTRGSPLRIIDIQRTRSRHHHHLSSQQAFEEQQKPEEDTCSRQPPHSNRNSLPSRNPEAHAELPTSSGQQQDRWTPQQPIGSAQSPATRQQQEKSKQQQQLSGETLSSFESDYDLLVYLGETETEDIVDTEHSLDYQDQTWRQSICDGASLAPTIDESLADSLQAHSPYLDLLGRPPPPHQAAGWQRSVSRQTLGRPTSSNQSSNESAPHLSAAVRTPVDRQRLGEPSSSLAAPHLGPQNSSQRAALFNNNNKKLPDWELRSRTLGAQMDSRVPARVPAEPTASRNMDEAAELDRLLAEMSQSLDLDALARYDTRPQPSIGPKRPPAVQNRNINQPRQSQTLNPRPQQPTANQQVAQVSSESILNDLDGASRMLEQMILEGQRPSKQVSEPSKSAVRRISEAEERKLSSCSSSAATEATCVIQPKASEHTGGVWRSAKVPSQRPSIVRPPERPERPVSRDDTREEKPPELPAKDYDLKEPPTSPDVIRVEASELPSGSDDSDAETRLDRVKRRTLSSMRSMRSKLTDLVRPETRRPPAEAETKQEERRSRSSRRDDKSFGQQIRERLSRSKSRFNRLLKPAAYRRAQSTPSREPAALQEGSQLFQPSDIARNEASPDSSLERHLAADLAKRAGSSSSSSLSGLERTAQPSRPPARPRSVGSPRAATLEALRPVSPLSIKRLGSLKLGKRNPTASDESLSQSSPRAGRSRRRRPRRHKSAATTPTQPSAEYFGPKAPPCSVRSESAKSPDDDEPVLRRLDVTTSSFKPTSTLAAVTPAVAPSEQEPEIRTAVTPTYPSNSPEGSPVRAKSAGAMLGDIRSKCADFLAASFSPRARRRAAAESPVPPKRPPRSHRRSKSIGAAHETTVIEARPASPADKRMLHLLARHIMATGDFFQPSNRRNAKPQRRREGLDEPDLCEWRPVIVQQASKDKSNLRAADTDSTWDSASSAGENEHEGVRSSHLLAGKIYDESATAEADRLHLAEEKPASEHAVGLMSTTSDNNNNGGGQICKQKQQGSRDANEPFDGNFAQKWPTEVDGARSQQVEQQQATIDGNLPPEQRICETPFKFNDNLPSPSQLLSQEHQDADSRPIADVQKPPEISETPRSAQFDERTMAQQQSETRTNQPEQREVQVEEKRLSVYENVTSSEPSKPARQWRRPPSAPAKPAHLVARSQVRPEEEAQQEQKRPRQLTRQSTFDVGAEDSQQTAAFLAHQRARHQELVEAARAIQSAESEPRAPSRTERQLVSMTSIIQEPEDELMAVQSTVVTVAPVAAQSDLAPIEQQDAPSDGDDTDSSLANALQSRHRLLSRFQRAASPERARTKHPAFSEGKSAAGSLVKRLARNFEDQAATSSSRPAGGDQTRSIDEESRSESTWYDAKSVELLDEDELAELLREFGGPADEQPPGSQSTDQFVTIDDDEQPPAEVEPATSDASEATLDGNDGTLNDWDDLNANPLDESYRSAADSTQDHDNSRAQGNDHNNDGPKASERARVDTSGLIADPCHPILSAPVASSELPAVVVVVEQNGVQTQNASTCPPASGETSQPVDTKFKNSLNHIIARRSSQQSASSRMEDTTATGLKVAVEEANQQQEKKKAKKKRRKGLSKYYHALIKRGRSERTSSSSSSSSSSSLCSSDNEDDLQDGERLARAAKKCSRLCEELERILAHRAAKGAQEDEEAGPAEEEELSSSSGSSDSQMRLPVQVMQRQNLQKLYHVVNEIHSSESKFVDTLRLLNVDLRAHLERNCCPAEGLAGISSLIPQLAHLPQLQRLNENLLDELRLARDRWPETQKIAHVLVKIGPFLKHYSTYIREFEPMQQQLNDNLRRQPQLAEQVRLFELSHRAQRLSVQHHLLKPVQRIPQYRLLLQQYLHHLKPDDADYEDTVNALEVVSRVAEHANRSMQEGANFAKLLALQAKMVGKRGEPLVQPGRQLVKEGELLKVSRKQLQPRWFVLLTDALLYLTQFQSSDILYLNRQLSLDDCQVECSPDDAPSASLAAEREFTVCTKQRSLALIASSRQERDQWVAALRQTVDEHQARRRSFSLRSQDESASLSGSLSSLSQLGHKAPLWTPDAKTSVCQLCTSNFTALFRRHHCRACGRVVCSACSSHKAPLAYLKGRRARVCDQCRSQLKQGARLAPPTQ